MITIMFTVDIDNDGVNIANERNHLVWDSVAEVPRIADVFERRGVRATWFVRADNQLEQVYGDPAWLLREEGLLWRDLRSAGHAIGWHPHVVRQDESGSFIAETDDRRCAEALRLIHSSLERSGFAFTASRIGEAFHGNESMNALDELGLAIDATAIPGRRRDDEARSFDWMGTPNFPYHPSRADYRIPGQPALSILEVPMTTMAVHAPYDDRPLTRYLNVAYGGDVFRDAVRRYFEFLGEGDQFIATILHPDETRGPAKHPLYGHDLRTVESNVDFLLAAARETGDIRIATIDELAP